MKTLRFVITLIVMLAIGIILNTKFSEVPPIGKLLSPFHGYLQNIESSALQADETKSLEGLQAPVKVSFDDMEVAHIDASNEHDLYFMQGYIHARDRLWQMDFLTRVTLGRVSEILGKRALNFDRLNRRIGLKMITDQSWAEVQKDPDLKEMFEAYSKGVNAYIDQLSYADYPIEFKLLDYEPEPWTPLKSCFAQSFYSNTLSRSESDLENTNAVSIFGKELFDKMYPEQIGNLDPVIPAGTKWNFTSSNPLNELIGQIIQTPSTIMKSSPLSGSNNFSVSGSKTANGHVIVGNEMDLNLTQPSVWHITHQISPTLNLYGVAVPGIPLLMVGFNDSIAWGISNSPRDQVDWYSIKFRNSRRDEYWYNNQWFKTEKVIEKIKVRDEPAYLDTVIYVHHGPVVYDRNFYGENEKNNYAMRWMAHETSASVKGMYLVNRAQNINEFKSALQYLDEPPENFVFGSATGDNAIFLPGNFPIKRKGQGKFLLDGSNPDYDWTATIPREHMLYSINPERGFSSSANQQQVDTLYPYNVWDHHYEKYRNRRVNDRLEVMSDIKPKDLMKLQNDNFYYKAYESLPAMLDSLDTASLNTAQQEFYDELKHWDYFAEPELTAPTRYDLWFSVLYDMVWDEFDTASIELNKPDHFTTIYLLQKDPTFPLFDVVSTKNTEGVKDLYQRSFNKAVDSLQNWKVANGEDFRWFVYKNTRVNHLLRLAPFSREKVNIGGGKGIVNAASSHWGPSWRMIVELDPAGVNAWGVYPGSQTGNPANPNYGNMIDPWAEGKYLSLVFRNISQSDRIIYKASFNPDK